MIYVGCVLYISYYKLILQNGQTALYIATMHGYTNIAKLLLSCNNDLDVNIQDNVILKYYIIIINLVSY